MTLKITYSSLSEAGKNAGNADFSGVHIPEKELLSSKGIAAAIADGIGESMGGRRAAEYAVLSILNDYYDTPETWGIPRALDKLIGAINRWLLAQNGSRRELSNMASTLSVLVLHRNRFTLAHVGDTRIYRLRGEDLTLLTHDHVWEMPSMNHVLKRAVGLDQYLAVDYESGELRKGDIFLMVSDGVWEALRPDQMLDMLQSHPEPQQASRALIDAALANGSTGNVTAMVLRVDDISEETLSEMLLDRASLVLPPQLNPGQEIDGYEVVSLLNGSRDRLIYKVREIATGRMLVLKTLPRSMASNTQAIHKLIAEEWMGKHLPPQYFPQYLTAAPGDRHFLYTVRSFLEGRTLANMLAERHHFTIDETVQIGIKLSKGLGALHRHDIIHRDIRPENLHLGTDGRLRILDLGTAVNPGLSQQAEAAYPGSRDYTAPEIFANENASIQSDLYSAGVTLYYLLTEKYPYGDIEANGQTAWFDPVPPSRYRPDIPPWLDNILLKAVARRSSERFEMPEEFLLALERGENAAVPAFVPTPLASRDPLLWWKVAATISIFINLLLMYIDAVKVVCIDFDPPW
jgi:serine/threonine protein phosphatase PrpC